MLVEHFQCVSQYFVEGRIYDIARFKVEQCPTSYRTVSHDIGLNFTRDTVIKSLPVPHCKFLSTTLNVFAWTILAHQSQAIRKLSVSFFLFKYFCFFLLTFLFKKYLLLSTPVTSSWNKNRKVIIAINIEFFIQLRQYVLIKIKKLYWLFLDSDVPDIIGRLVAIGPVKTIQRRDQSVRLQAIHLINERCVVMIKQLYLKDST